jgi:uncharacterized integral membrane protein (TIGR00698 family)
MSEQALDDAAPQSPTPLRAPLARAWALASTFGPGLILAAVIATAARFAADHSGGPPMVYALALGLSLGVMADESRCQPGLDIAARSVMRCGIILMGLQFSVGDLIALGPAVLLAIIALVATIVLAGIGVGRAFGLKSDAALLTACATAICGATATLAIGSVLPRRPELERLKGVIIATIALFSTVAMVAGPAVLSLMGLSDRAIGFVLGATIADVAQVISAGFSVSDEAGRMATLVKLVRVSCLLPTVILVGLAFRKHHLLEGASKPAVVPGFMVGFAALVAINSLGVVPPAMAQGATDVSRWCLLAAIAAVGVQTSMRDMALAGLKPFWTLLGLVLLLAGLAFGAALLVV